MNKQSLSFSGRARAQAIDENGEIRSDSGWSQNLFLDQGMDALASQFIADIFTRCAAGTDDTATKRTLSGTVSQTGGTNTLTASASNFSADDVGRVLYTTTGGNLRRITGYTNATTVTVDATGAIVALGAKVYNVEQVALVAEAKRTSSYGSTAGDNGTSTAAAVRTFKRTFLFSAETGSTTYKEVGFSHLDAKPSRSILSLVAGVDVVVVTYDEPHYLQTGDSVVIAAVSGSSPSLNGTKVATVTSPTEITVPSVGVTTAGTGGTITPVAIERNTNIRLVLAAPVVVAAAQRLKVIYELSVTVAPATSTVGDAPITGGTGVQFAADLAGHRCIESFATSLVAISGATDSTEPFLDPCFAAKMAMSDDATALEELTGAVVRGTNVSYVDSAAVAAYVANSFTRDFQGMFDLEDGNSAAIRSIMLIYDDTGSHGVFTFRFATAQTKNDNHALTLIVTKTWGRTLS